MEFTVLLLVCSFLVMCCHGDYTCLCNYNVEIPVYSGADRSTQVIGYMYEFDCKNLLSENDPTWSTIEFEHQMGFIHSNGQVKIQTCPGDIPDEDRIKSTSVPISPTFITKAKSSRTTMPESSFSSAKMTSPFHHTSLLPSTPVKTTVLALSSTSSNPAGSFYSVVTQTTGHSSISVRNDSSMPTFSAVTSTVFKPTLTSVLFTLLNTTTSPKLFSELSTNNPLYGLSTTQFIGTTISTQPKTNHLSKPSSSKISTFTNPIIPFSSGFTSAASTNPISTSVRNTISQSLRTQFSPILSHTTLVSSPSSTNSFGRVSTSLQDTSTTHPSTSVTSMKPTISSKSRPGISETPSHIPNSVSTRVPWTILSSTLDQTFTKNFTRTTEKVSVSDRVDLCPYKNLAMSIYNRTTFTYPLFRQYDNYCYELRLKLGDWFEAQRDCVSRGGELAVIQNEEVQARVYNLTSSLKYKTDVWIGLHDLNKEGQWEWVSGEKMTRTSFNRGILINPAFSDAQDCVIMDGKSGMWKNTACKSFLLDIQSYPWVCQYKMT